MFRFRAATPSSRPRVPLLTVMLLLAACGDDQPASGSAAKALTGGAVGAIGGAAPASGPRASSRLEMVVGPTCEGTGAHDKHAAMGIACAACHPCGGKVGFTNVVSFPGGTTDKDGTYTLNGLSTTCSVGCHSPLGATPQTVAWNAGPLACTSCHNNVVTSGNIVSSHFAGISNPGGACTQCHDVSQHTKGQVLLVSADGSSTPGTCAGCHSGQGQTLNGYTPPLLVGWTDTTRGDFHGSRMGTGSGGTLLSPYSRGYPPLACTACHDPHSSGNPFIFAATVNGATIPAGAITRAGVGAEALCNGCHQGDRHAYCKTCHTVDPRPPGSTCFYCHGHEGIVNWPTPGSWEVNMLTGDMTNDPSCYHCHSYAPPPNPNRPPAIQSGRMSGGGIAPAPSWFPNPPILLLAAGNVFNVTGTSASIWWETDRSATTFVEWGTSTAGLVSGYPTTPTSYLAYPYELYPPPYQSQVFHRVDLTGLTPGTTYVWRIRTVDQFRSVNLTALQTFTTAVPGAPSAPVPVLEPEQYNPNPSGASVLTFPVSPPLTWSAVTSSLGNPISYRVVAATDAAFTQNVTDSGWISTTSFSLNVRDTMDTRYTTYYWHVMARDTTTGVQSSWSATSSFRVFVDDPNSY